MPSIKQRIATALARRAARAAGDTAQRRAEQIREGVVEEFTTLVSAFLGNDANQKLAEEQNTLARETATWLMSLKEDARKFKENADTLQSTVLTAIEPQQFAMLKEKAPAKIKDYQTFLKKTTENATKIQLAVSALRQNCTAQNVRKLETAITRAAADYNAWSRYIAYMQEPKSGISKAVAFELKKPFIKVGRWLSDLAKSASAYFQSAILLEETRLIQGVLASEKKARAEATQATSGLGAQLEHFGATLTSKIPRMQEQGKQWRAEIKEEREFGQEATFLDALEKASRETSEVLKQVTNQLDQALSTHAAQEAAVATQSKHEGKQDRRGLSDVQPEPRTLQTINKRRKR